MTALVVAGAVALHTPDPSQRRLLGEVVGLHMTAELRPPPTSAPLEEDVDESSAAPGTSHGYRRAVVITEPGFDCDPGLHAVDCGAKLEIFRHARQARHRADHLSERGEDIRRHGALVLRLSHELSHDRRGSYASAFDRAVEELDGLADVARLEREG